MKRGDLVMVRDSEENDWIYAHFSHHNERTGKIHVISNGASAWTETSMRGCLQRFTMDDELFEDIGGYELAFASTECAFWKMPSSDDSTTSEPRELTDTPKESLKHGDSVLVRYEDNESWTCAHFDCFWGDGRIQVIGQGASAYTKQDPFGLQPHQIDKPGSHAAFFVNTFNFWRLPGEAFGSEDLRETEQYKRHWK